jgi:hypothetical protein
MKRLLYASLAALLVPVCASAADAPAVSIKLGARHGHVTPQVCGCAKTGGGNITVAQATPDVLTITMTGAAVATVAPCAVNHATMQFDLEQCFEVSIDDPEAAKGFKFEIEGTLIGALRSHCKGGSASVSQACASIACGEAEVVALSLPSHGVDCGQNLAINDQAGPTCVPGVPGCFTLHQTFGLEASAPRGLCGRPATAEFADGAIKDEWLPLKEPFNGIDKKPFGLVITVRVVPVEGNGNGGEKKPEALPPPKP